MNIDELAEKLAGDIFDAEGEWPERLRPERVASWSRIIKKAVELELLQAQRERDEANVSVKEMKEWCKAQRGLYDMAISNQENWMRKWDATNAETTQLRNAVDKMYARLFVKTDCLIIPSECECADCIVLNLANNLPHRIKSPSPSASDGSTNR